MQREVVLFRYPGISLWLLYIKMVMYILYDYERHYAVGPDELACVVLRSRVTD